MRLEGIHHVTAITGDAPGNVDFYARLLGMRMVKKTVNFDAPDVYHLYYGDEGGTPGSVLTFFEFPGAARGRDGAGMVHRIAWRVAGEQALDFWAERLAAEEIESERSHGLLRFADPEGLGLELRAGAAADAPLRAEAGGVPAEHALTGFDGVRAYGARHEESGALFAGTLGFEDAGPEGWIVRGDERHALYTLEEPPGKPGVQGAGTVHHVAWACRDDEQEEWRGRALEARVEVTPIIDRDYFHSIYFREPSGVLFEIATMGPGFTVDEPLEHLGEELRLPRRYQELREQLERSLTPLANPRAGAAGR